MDLQFKLVMRKDVNVIHYCSRQFEFTKNTTRLSQFLSCWNNLSEIFQKTCIESELSRFTTSVVQGHIGQTNQSSLIDTVLHSQYRRNNKVINHSDIHQVSINARNRKSAYHNRMRCSEKSRVFRKIWPYSRIQISVQLQHSYPVRKSGLWVI